MHNVIHKFKNGVVVGIVVIVSRNGIPQNMELLMQCFVLAGGNKELIPL
jgi:hypothetical protein